MDKDEFESALIYQQETDDILGQEFQIKGRICKATIRKVFERLSAEEAWDYFTDYVIENYPLTKAALVFGLRCAFIYGEGHGGATYFFKRIGLRNILHADERKLYDSLPKTISIYRGINKLEIDRGYLGLSWTLSRGVAEWFAFRGVHYDDVDGRVYSIKIRKSRMLALFLDRNESEVVFPYASTKYKSLKLVTDKPTDYFVAELQNKRNQNKTIIHVK